MIIILRVRTCARDLWKLNKKYLMTLFTLWLQMCIIKVQGCIAYPWPRFVVKNQFDQNRPFWKLNNPCEMKSFLKTTVTKQGHFWTTVVKEAIFKITVIKLCHFWKLNNRYKKGSFLKNQKIQVLLSKMFRAVWFWLILKIKFLQLWWISWVFEIYVTLD